VGDGARRRPSRMAAGPRESRPRGRTPSAKPLSAMMASCSSLGAPQQGSMGPGSPERTEKTECGGDDAGELSGVLLCE